jgi:hypothetical protein
MLLKADPARRLRGRRCRLIGIDSVQRQNRNTGQLRAPHRKCFAPESIYKVQVKNDQVHRQAVCFLQSRGQIRSAQQNETVAQHAFERTHINFAAFDGQNSHLISPPVRVIDPAN